MIDLTLGEIAGIVGGRLTGIDDADDVPTVTGSVEFDSRRLTAGGLFVAMPGERVDGHDFAAGAVAEGAAGVLAARKIGPGVPTVVVPPVESAPTRSVALAGDTGRAGAAVLAGLAALASGVVDRLPELTVVAVTGSSGKTSTKDLIATLLEPLGPTVAPPGSFNNELGHPWTVLRCDETTRNLVVELSARGPGHIAALCAVAPPRIGVLLNVGSAHLGEFGSREEIARTKAELIEALPPANEGGVAVLNADDPVVVAATERTTARVLTVGEAEGADLRAVGVTLDEQARASFLLSTPYGDADVALGLHGAHQVGNALAAAAVAIEVGIAGGGQPKEVLAQVAERLSAARPVSARRMEVHTRADGLRVINDSYNANPESVRAALHALATMATSGGRRSWAVLGVMGELGESSGEAHEEIGRLAARLSIGRVVAVGEDAMGIRDGANREGPPGEESVLVADVDAALALLRAELRPDDVVLLKASNVAELWRVADGLLNDTAVNGSDRPRHAAGDLA